MARTVTPFLMFEGSAEAAMNFYVSLFPGSRVDRIERYGPGEPGAEGSVKKANFTVAGQAVFCIASSPGSTIVLGVSWQLNLARALGGRLTI